jgi:hypothetical protein
MHPLYWMHSALPGGGYDSKTVSLPSCQFRLGSEQSGVFPPPDPLPLPEPLPPPEPLELVLLPEPLPLPEPLELVLLPERLLREPLEPVLLPELLPLLEPLLLVLPPAPGTQLSERTEMSPAGPSPGPSVV